MASERNWHCYFRSKAPPFYRYVRKDDSGKSILFQIIVDDRRIHPLVDSKIPLTPAQLTELYHATFLSAPATQELLHRRDAPWRAPHPSPVNSEIHPPPPNPSFSSS